MGFYGSGERLGRQDRVVRAVVLRRPLMVLQLFAVLLFRQARTRGMPGVYPPYGIMTLTSFTCEAGCATGLSIRAPIEFQSSQGAYSRTSGALAHHRIFSMAPTAVHPSRLTVLPQWATSSAIRRESIRASHLYLSFSLSLCVSVSIIARTLLAGSLLSISKCSYTGSGKSRITSPTILPRRSMGYLCTVLVRFTRC
jgi:hypothetical protein